MSSPFRTALAGTRFYPLTDRYLSKLSHAEQVAHLARQGARLVQLREKLLSPAEFYVEAAAAIRVGRDLGVKIIINDRVDIALALEADGVHLGQDDLPPEAARSILGEKAIIGFSTHNVEQARQALQMPVDYIATGPVFATSTKANAEKPLGLLELSRIREVVGETPLVAIGGITSENSQSVIEAGADAVAVIRDIWASQNSLADRTSYLLQTPQ
ncbi:MAG TPA: thiamine phosphate synthase [Pyrinomonadaceae bacterium]|nr:thiamine phosphate synthase [Pyrinomonadaceae bacterium]